MLLLALHLGAASPLMQSVPSAGLGQVFGFVQGAGDSSPTLREGHHVIFNVNQIMLADGTPGFTFIRGTARALMNLPACETPG